MKLTRKKLKEMILKEISGTGGATADIKKRQAAKTDVRAKVSTKKTKKSAWDTAKSTYTTKSDALDTKQSTYNTKDSALTSFAGRKYRKAAKVPGGYQYSATLQRGYSLNPDWTLKNNARTSALSDKNTAKSEKTSAERDRDTKETDYNTAVDNLTASEKAEKAIKAQTSFAYGAGGGGRAGGKGGTAKGKGKGGKGKDESVFRILGRDVINEIDDIKSLLKHQKELHKK
tara:strand:- start:1063 stop:1752 length:690 start_codon:yes stop_codon:yes gene_type:complete